MSIVSLRRGRDLLLAVDPAVTTPIAVCERIVEAFHEVARFEWCAVMTTDPQTHLPSGGTVQGFSPDVCGPFWENELSDPDFNKFADLARRIDPVATLNGTLEGEPSRSPRYAGLYAPMGAADELRTVFRSGEVCLGVGVFVREGAHGPFSAEELTDVQGLVPLAATVLQRASGRIAADREVQPPVVLILDDRGRATAMSAGSREVLEDLRVQMVDPEVPGVVQVAAAKVRNSRTTTRLTTRLRGKSGRWLRLHAATLEDDPGSVAVTVETAGPHELVQVLLDSYGLTPRETEIVLRLCRGQSSKVIAGGLGISVHTVRDHCKAIYEKAGVAGRGELVARLFSDHVLARMHGAVTHLRAPVADSNAR